MAELSWDSFVETLNSNNVPEILLLLMGVVALAIVFAYMNDKESVLYKILMIAGVAMGAFMVYVAMAIETGWDKGTLIVLTVAAFTLIVRPIRNVNVAAVIGLIVAVWVYLILPDLVNPLEPPFDFLHPLASGIPRLIVAIVAGAMVFTILQFIQALVSLFGKILNAWPFLIIIGIWCIVEAVFLLMGYSSTYDYIVSLFKDSST